MIGDAGDETERAARARYAVVARGAQAERAGDRLDRILRVKALEQNAGRYEGAVGREPAVKRHVLDEADVHVVAPGELDEAVDLVLDAGQQHGVDLDGRKAGRKRRVESGESGDERAAAGEPRVALRVEAVDAHVDALEAGRAQIGGAARQQDGVGREREVGEALERGKPLDEADEPLAHERLAAGHADPRDAGGHGGGGESQQLLVGQDLVVRARRHALGRHAVDAAQVAPVGDREPQIVDATRGGGIHDPSVARPRGCATTARDRT